MSNLEEKFVPEPERYEFSAAPVHQFELARRDFFKLLGAGIAVFAIAKDALALQETPPGPRNFRSEELPKEIGAWVHVGEDGSVTAFAGKAEIGQNIRTSLAQTIADELRVPFESVRMLMADTAFTPFDAGTFGSRTTPTMTPQFRRVTAAARDLLLGVAAKEWNVAPEGLIAADAKVTDPASGRSLRYAELARGKTLAQTLPAEDPITPASQWTIAGKPVPKVNGRAFVTGRHQYTPDLRPDGLLYGKVLRPASFGATLTSVDDAEARAMSGVLVVRDGDFVGVAAPTEHEAQLALAVFVSEAECRGQVRGALSKAKRFRRRGARWRGAPSGCGVHRRLHRARPARTACGRGPVDRWKAHGLDRHAAAVRCARRACRCFPRSREQCAGDRAGYGFRLRRQAHQRRGARSGSAGARRRASRESGVGARGRIHLGIFPAGGRHRSQKWHRRRWRADGMGISQLQFRNVGH